MKVIKIAKKEWAGGLERLSDSFLLIGPVKQDKFHYFKELKKGEPPDLNLLNTRLSPKSVVYPQSEIMFEYTLDKNQEDHNILKEIDKDYSPRGVIGIRPCDAKAFLLVKANFDAPEYKDPYWIKSYKATTFVGYACNTPCSTCFCTTAGCGPFHEQGLDLLLVDAGGHYLLKIITEKGENLLTAAGWSEKTDAVAAGDQIEAMKHAVEAKITARVATEKLQAGVLTFKTKPMDLPEYACVIGIAVCIRCLLFTDQATIPETPKCNGFARGSCTSSNTMWTSMGMEFNVLDAVDALATVR